MIPGLISGQRSSVEFIMQNDWHFISASEWDSSGIASITVQSYDCYTEAENVDQTSKHLGFRGGQSLKRSCNVL